MCGILGLLKLGDKADSAKFIKALNCLKHRGPDSSGIYVSPCEKLLLGHQRLAILDLSKLGAQPMTSRCGKYHLVFNGEIYNYEQLRLDLIAKGFVFKSNSDTEVLLYGYAYWGEAVLQRINGPFSFAVYDENKDELFLARDRIGEKPLFFAEEKGGVIFSSELKPFLELRDCENSFNGDALVSYLSRGYPMKGSTLLSGVRSLRPAHFLRVCCKSGNLKISKYWSPGYGDNDSSSNLQELTEEFKGIFSSAINLQLQCDVPACVLLSGGVDSSLITAMASEHRSSVSTFTVKFEGYPEFDETDSARLISRYFGTSHTEISASEMSPGLIEKIAHDLDAPINDSSLIPTYLVYQEVSNFCKVALGGDGGDEFFGGYKHYSRLNTLQYYLGSVLPLLPSKLAQSIKRKIPPRYRWRNWVVALSCNLKNECPNIREIFDLNEALKLLNTSYSASFTEDFYADWTEISSEQSSALKNALNADINSYLPESILVKSDRASMLNSVESRAPFLDTRLIDFAMKKIPDSLKATRNDRKILLKEFGRKVLPPGFDFKRKLGFNLPLADLIRGGHWKSYFHDVIFSKYSFLNREHCINLLYEHLNGANHADKLFGIVLLIRWSQINNVTNIKFKK